MRKLLLFIFITSPLLNGCTILDVESTKTETVTTTESKQSDQYRKLEARIEALGKRVSALEQ